MFVSNLGIIRKPGKQQGNYNSWMDVFGIIVRKCLTQTLLKDRNISVYVERGKGVKTAGPVEEKHVSGIIAELRQGREDRGKPELSQFDEYRVVYLTKLVDASLLTIDEKFEPYYLTKFAETLDESAKSLHDCLAALLPEGVVVPSSYETIGHIAHLNLLPEHLPFKKQIGELIIQKVPAIRTVVNKRHELESEFRACPLELIGGEPDYQAIHIEYGLRFHIDYEKVFWNSRLSGERHRLSCQIPPHSDIFDVMGGVGGFGIYLAKFSQCRVVTNDLNEAAYQCALKNIAVNRVSGSVRACCMDGRQFIRDMICPRFGPSCLRHPLEFHFTSSESLATESSAPEKKRRLLSAQRDADSTSDVGGTGEESQEVVVPDVEDGAVGGVYFLMNLPKIAIDFLDAFKGAYRRNSASLADCREPHVLVYCFASPQDYKERIGERIKAVLGEETLYRIESITLVRNVSPSKNQYCVDMVMTMQLIATSS